MVLYGRGQGPSQEGVNRATLHEDHRVHLHRTIINLQVGLANLPFATFGEPITASDASITSYMGSPTFPK